MPPEVMDIIMSYLAHTRVSAAVSLAVVVLGGKAMGSAHQWALDFMWRARNAASESAKPMVLMSGPSCSACSVPYTYYGLSVSPVRINTLAGGVLPLPMDFCADDRVCITCARRLTSGPGLDVEQTAAVVTQASCAAFDASGTTDRVPGASQLEVASFDAHGVRVCATGVARLCMSTGGKAGGMPRALVNHVAAAASDMARSTSEVLLECVAAMQSETPEARRAMLKRLVRETYSCSVVMRGPTFFADHARETVECVLANTMQHTAEDVFAELATTETIRNVYMWMRCHPLVLTFGMNFSDDRVMIPGATDLDPLTTRMFANNPNARAFLVLVMSSARSRLPRGPLARPAWQFEHTRNLVATRGARPPQQPSGHTADDDDMEIE